MLVEWRTSGHANALASSLYRKLRSKSADGASCDRCHGPLLQFDSRHRVAKEGVTCDVCHNIKEVAIPLGARNLAITAHDMTKYGPRCESKDHYFHRMGCSELHSESEVCGACHQMENKVGGQRLPVFTSYGDWKAGPYATDGVTCQNCHMPGAKAVVAQGSPERSGVPDHGFLGKARALRERAIALSVSATEVADEIDVRVTLANVGAGHFVPSGLPARRLAVIVRAKPESGRGGDPVELERELGRKLVDAAGAEVPFVSATRVAADTRIGPRAERVERFVVAAGYPGRLEISLEWRSLSSAIAESLSATADAVPLARVEIPFGPPGHRRLPKTASAGAGK